MLGPDERNTITFAKDSSLWFNVDSVDRIIELLTINTIEMDLEAETFYGRKVVSFKDINGYAIHFSCAA